MASSTVARDVRSLCVANAVLLVVVIFSCPVSVVSTSSVAAPFVSTTEVPLLAA